MALIKCPECGAEVSDQAKACPKCAYPLKEPEPVKPQKIKVESQEGCFLETLNFGCVFIAIIIIIILVYILTSL